MSSEEVGLNILVGQYLESRFPDTFRTFVRESSSHHMLPTSIFSEQISADQFSQMISTMPQDRLASIVLSSGYISESPELTKDRTLTLGDQLISALDEGRSQPTFESRSEVYGHEEKVFCVTFDRTGQILISGSDDETVKVWKVPALELLFELNIMEGPISNISIHPENEYFAVSSLDDCIRLFDMSGALKKELEVEDCQWAGFSRTGKYLAALSYGKVRLWITSDILSDSSLVAGTADIAITMPSAEWEIDNICFSPADEFAVFSGLHGIYVVVDLVQGYRVKIFDVHMDWIDCMEFGEYSCELFYSLASCETSIVLTYSESELFDRTCRFCVDEHENVTSASFLCNDTKIVALSHFHAGVFSTITRESLLKISFESKTWQVRTHPLLYNLCVVACDDGSAYVFELSGGTLIQQLEPMTGSAALDITFSLDGQLIATSDSTGRVVVYGSWAHELQFFSHQNVHIRTTKAPNRPSEMLYHSKFRGSPDASAIQIVTK